MKKRPPIIVVLGHVDHGKSTLLDYIQNTKIVEKEAGGITQKVSAYEIEFKGEKITFIDTPGHEAFSKLRERGAKIADIGILVVAGDEGVMPQTIESIKYLKSYNIPFIVAINKIDRPNANPEKVKKELSENEVIVEEWGGNVPCVNISALKGEGIDDLLEIILIMADILDLKYDEDKKGEGYILETSKDPKRGILVGGIVVDGKVSIGDYIVTASSYGKIRFLEDSFGKKLDYAYPSRPILISGFESLPNPGENFKIVEKDEIETIKKELEDKERGYEKKIIISTQEPTGDINIILRGDHLGSLEALSKIFEKVSKDLNKNIKIIKSDLGPITTDDIKLAKESGAILVAFNVKNQKNIYEEIKNLNLKLIESNVIYEIENILKDLKEEKEGEIVKGRLEVLGIFNKTATKKTIGGKVLAGKLRLNNRVLIKRGEAIIGRGKILSLEKNKVPVEEVLENELCGLIVETNIDFELNDIIEVI
ncbi:MAG: translation initiation factor IF-2 [Minisyncoccia bacterium]